MKKYDEESKERKKIQEEGVRKRFNSRENRKSNQKYDQQQMLVNIVIMNIIRYKMINYWMSVLLGTEYI